MQGQARGPERGGAVRCGRTSFHADPKTHGECCKMEEAMATAKRKRSPRRDEILLPPPTSPTRLSTPKNRDHDTAETASVCSVKTN